jgi:hypothetical protein
MKKIARKKIALISTHVVGMCVVEKFMVQWKERSNLVGSSLCGLVEWMSYVQTDPENQSAILLYF